MFEALHTDQQRRWQNGERVLVDWYVQRHPELTKYPEVLAELILGEIALRQSRGEQPKLEEYLWRFAGCEETLRGRSIAVAAIPAVDNYGTVVAHADGSVGSDGSLGHDTVVGSQISAATPPPSQPASAATDFSITPQSKSVRRSPSQEFATVVAAQGDESSNLDTFVEPVDGPDLPGFEILGELGRGGMGIVYKARQLSADRLVALKVVRNDVLDTMPLASRASTLERFQQEAQASARLEHDNLVTVFEVGTANGLRYYAMRFVEGRSLYDMLRDGPLDNRRAAGYLEPVSRGLHYAHQRGILHRDLKPHNILIDENLDRPLVADFGLAKFMERRDELTHAGELMGTPSYMSPEQARNAASVTALADVYSLGATLYHVLTLRPPFQAANVGETIRQIIDDEPVAPRQLNPAIDRDLETICLKCLQKEPARRYGSAELLAEDLRRYLNREPILARPVGMFGRTWRWCRRKPVQAGLIALAISLAFISLSAIIIGYRNTSAALAESESRLQKALQVVDELFTRVSEDELLNEPGMQPLRKDLLARALKHYQYFLAESGGKSAIKDEVGAARFRVGLIMQATGERDKAFDEFKAARTLQEQLLEQQPSDSRRLKALADTINALGSLYREQEAWEDAALMFKRAISLRAQLVSLERSNDEFQRLLANARMNLAQIKMKSNDNAEARELMVAAQTTRRSLLDKNPKARRDLAMGSYNLATLSVAEKKTDDAVKQFREAIQQFEELLEKDGRSLANRYLVAVCYRQLGFLLMDSGNISTALINFEVARRGMASLAVGNPDVVFYQTELAYLTMNLAALYDEQNDLPKAHEAWSQVLLNVQGLLRSDAANPEYRRHEAAALGAIGNLQVRTGEDLAANEMLNTARERLQKLLEEFPDDDNLKLQLVDTMTDLSKLFDKRHDLAGALGASSQSLQIVQGLLRRDAENLDYRRLEATSLMTVGKLQIRSGTASAARETLAKARDCLQKLLASSPDDAELKQQLADTRKDLTALEAGLSAKQP